MNEDMTKLWMVPYADLMSILMLLFLMLFATSHSMDTPEHGRAVAHLEKEMGSGPKADKRFDEADLAVQIKDEMGRLRLSDFGVRVTARQVRLTLPNPVLFGEGSATLSADAGAILIPLARLFSKCENPILIEGYTDDVRLTKSPYRSNWELSAARSFAVVEYLLAHGLQPDRFNVRGYGQYRPVASNLTAEGRMQNRRIEISLIRDIEKVE
jgi:chemotaxis protein MotB